MTMFRGHFHRRSIDMERAMVRSGIFGACHRACIWLNAPHGPWQTGGFLNAIQEMALEITQLLGPDHAIVLWIWPKVCRAHG